MKRILLSLCLCGALAFLAACEEAHFISDADYRERVGQDFQAKQALLPNGDLFAIFANDGLTSYEREALTFLYAYIPLPDVTDYPGSFHLTNVRAAQKAAAEMPWGKTVPEDLFRHFVLPVRVNNEPLDSARVVFYEELAPRVKNLSMAEAILEVNHWCHEKATYAPSDARTSSPLATVRTAYGRCGEESTFLVAALRSVGIPARQVYTPRWAHSDDNHAWVEAWADGQWHFLGACEPEAVLDLGWFNAPASRGMLMHTKVFGRYEGPEEVMTVTPCYTEINVLDNYASAAQASVSVADEQGHPVPDATVEFKLYNYAEFHTVATKHTDASGQCSLTAGRGDMVVWASKDGRFGFDRLSFGRQKTLTVVLDKQAGNRFSMDIDLVPPSENVQLPEVTDEQRAANDARLTAEDSLRNAYAATMFTEARAQEWVDSLAARFPDAPLADAERKRPVSVLVASRGNYPAICRFLTEAAASSSPKKAFALLGSISEKDRRDVSLEVLRDHLTYTPEVAAADSALYVRAVLNPRVATEELTPYKSFFRRAFTPEEQEAFHDNPQLLVERCKEVITLCDTLNPQLIPMTPAGVWRAGVADRLSRAICFVAMARSFGIPAWLDRVTGSVCYQPVGSDAPVYQVDFEQNTAEKVARPGNLRFTSTPVTGVDAPRYYSHFTLSRIDEGRLQLQNYPEDVAALSSLGRGDLPLAAGCYALVSGVRQPDGSVPAHIASVQIEEGCTTKAEITLREPSTEAKPLGSFDLAAAFALLSGDKEQTLAQVAGKGNLVLGILDYGREPTNHALRDIAAYGEELQSRDDALVLLFPDAAQAGLFSSDDFPGLPSSIVYGLDTKGLAGRLTEALKLRGDGGLPLFVVITPSGQAVFASQGYTIGLGEQLIKILSRL